MTVYIKCKAIQILSCTGKCMQPEDNYNSTTLGLTKWNTQEVEVVLI